VTLSDDPGFFLPQIWLRASKPITTYIQWFMQKYGVGDDSTLTQGRWLRLEQKVRRIQASLGRSLRVHVFKQSSVPHHFKNTNNRQLHIDVALDDRLSAFSSLYRMCEVTGLHFQVQAVIVAQAETPLVLYEAIDLIEEQDVDDFAFVCHGATHRSVACAVLLVSLVYQNARIYLSTPRTRTDALNLGLHPVRRTAA
jgi:hypothetical protein